MTDKYIYLFLGLILGLLIAIYYFISREEKIERKIIITKTKDGSIISIE